jgi:hypothetical protein
LFVKRELNLLYLTADKLVSFIILNINFIGVSELCFIKRINKRLEFVTELISFLLAVEVIIISLKETEPFFTEDPLTSYIKKI